jgi:hypothetical protein
VNFRSRQRPFNRLHNKTAKGEAAGRNPSLSCPAEEKAFGYVVNTPGGAGRSLAMSVDIQFEWLTCVAPSR